MEPSLKKKQKTAVKVKHEDDKNLKGTFISVLLLGGFIILTWASVYFLFLNRM